MYAMIIFSLSLMLWLGMKQTSKLNFKLLNRLGSLISCFILSAGFHGTAQAVSYQALTGIQSIGSSSGTTHACAVVNGGAKCWGSNVYGKVTGDGIATADQLTPVDVAGLATGVAQVVTGWDQSCARMTTGTVKCWGRNQWGQLGNNTTFDGPVAVVQVTGLTGLNIIKIAGGASHICALTSLGAVYCWGGHGNGALGDGAYIDRSAPVAVSGLSSGVTDISAGHYTSCAVLNDTAKCWGDNGGGQVGNGTSGNSYNVPQTVSGISNARSISGNGYAHTCALLADATVKCWGGNGQGQLADGTTTNRYTPVTISGLTGVTKLSVGWTHTCVLTFAGVVKCWGENNHGQIGNGTTTNTNGAAPVTVSGLSGVVDVIAGNYTSCALLNTGTAKCWGYDINGQLGNSTTADKLTPDATIGTNIVIPTVYYPLTVTNTSTSGSVTSDTGGINCGTTCTATYATNTVVTLTATPPTSNYIAVWSDACGSGKNTCTLTIDAAKSVSVRFVLGYSVSVSTPTNGQITAPYINCALGQTACNANYRNLTTTTFTATPKPGYTLSSWTGDCAGNITNTCALTINASKNLSANFSLPPTYSLSITKAGTGNGTVTSMLLNCGSSCSANYKSGVGVTLRASAATNSVFTGWMGACSGTASTCSVTMDAAKTVTATFSSN